MNCYWDHPNSMNVWFLMCWSSPVCRGSCWAHAAVTAPCAVLTSPVWFAGSAREAPGAVSSATSSTMSWPSAPRTRCRYSISLKLQRIWVRAKHWRASRFIGFYKRSKMMPSHCVLLRCVSVAGHFFDSDWEGADRRHYPGLTLPHRQYLLAGVVFSQPVCQVAAPGPALPDLLRHVRLHGHCVHRWEA